MPGTQAAVGETSELRATQTPHSANADSMFKFDQSRVYLGTGAAGNGAAAAALGADGWAFGFGAGCTAGAL